MKTIFRKIHQKLHAEVLIIRSLYFMLLIFILNSCGGLDDGVEDYKQVTLYEFNLETSERESLKTFEINTSKPFIHYLHDSYIKIIAQFHTIYFIQEDGKVEEFDLDSIYLSDDFYFDISPENKELIFSGYIVPPNSSLVFKNKGLYKFNLETKVASPFLIDSTGIAKFPSYSESGEMIVYKISGQGHGYGSKIRLINNDKTYSIDIDSSEYDLIKYGKFSQKDTKILYYKAPNSLIEYDLASNRTTLLVGEKYFPNGLLMNEYPVFNYSSSAKSLYYYCSTGKEACKPNSIYKFDYSKNTDEELFPGIIPMHVDKDIILYREDICGFESPSQIFFYDGVNQMNIAVANYGILSDDLKKIFYLHNETKKY